MMQDLPCLVLPAADCKKTLADCLSNFFVRTLNPSRTFLVETGGSELSAFGTRESQKQEQSHAEQSSKTRFFPVARISFANGDKLAAKII
jgi:hypothetical protein